MRTDMMKIILSFRNSANVPKNASPCVHTSPSANRSYTNPSHILKPCSGKATPPADARSLMWSYSHFPTYVYSHPTKHACHAINIHIILYYGLFGMFPLWLSITREKQFKWWYKVVQIWPGLFVCKQVTVCPGHIWTTLYITRVYTFIRLCNSCTRIHPSTRQCASRHRLANLTLILRITDT
jgi:hypothetical protein